MSLKLAAFGSDMSDTVRVIQSRREEFNAEKAVENRTSHTEARRRG